MQFFIRAVCFFCGYFCLVAVMSRYMPGVWLCIYFIHNDGMCEIS